MKKRITAIAAVLSLMPFGQPMVIGTGAILTSAAVLLSVPEKAQAESIQFYKDRAAEKKKRGDHYGAISDLNKAIAIDPEHFPAYLMRAIHKDELDDIYGAISDVNKAIAINSKYGDAFVLRGIFKQEIGDEKGACSDWRKASRLGVKYTAKWIREQC